ncbi:PROTEIN PHYTOCHROME KINASE SUBSTRATE 1-RELATED [Salix viminalis]|uniref:PROTEIN PHYTOCHROME KINASE SUBSTRATE 1-RELATED n=1 Tax=Salix viminalis TaxID=40686 RepID=A0A9Q0SHL8_SALVM|nr:PROTEIN PHYTOCHROME KINASE SUBSTRATE 1-RELATED [Salix viminalis]
MERSKVMKTMAAVSKAPQPVFGTIEPTHSYISCPQKSTVRDESSSSYLRPTPEQINQVDGSEICIFDAQSYYFNESGSDHKLNKRVSPANANPERISERYDFSSVPRFSSGSTSVVDGYGRNYSARSIHATPTASSEASWNSQTGLLSNPPGAVAVSMRNPPRNDGNKKGSGTKWLLGIKCPCSGKKSVQIEEKLSEARTPSRISHAKVCSDLKRQVQNQTPITAEKCLATPDWLERREVIPTTRRISADNKLQRREVIPNSHRILEDNNQFPSGSSHQLVVASARPFSTSGFSFPVLIQTPPPRKLVLPSAATYNPPLEDPPRDSLDVFRPGDDPIPTKSNSDLHRRQSFTVIDDGMASDASSDLFEIESFSTQTSYAMCPNRRDSLDDASSFNAIGGNLYCRRSLDDPRTPSIAPTESYEPSETSIDWSVATAEGFDRGSTANLSASASEVDEMTTRRGRENGRNDSGGGAGKKRGGLLMSCRREKAVSVGPRPIKCMATEGQRVASSAQRHVGTGAAIKGKPPPARSHSARSPLPSASCD